MFSMKSICVFCGSKLGSDEEYKLVTEQLATILVEQRIQIIYGGGSVGLMGVLADKALALGGRVIGVIPEYLCTQEIKHHNLTAIHVSPDLMERKRLMLELAEGFIALPGGVGTLDEILEVLTWGQLGQHKKPLALLNYDGFFNAFLHTLAFAEEKGFLDLDSLAQLLVEEKVESLVEKLQSSTPTPQKFTKL